MYLIVSENSGNAMQYAHGSLCSHLIENETKFSCASLAQLIRTETTKEMKMSQIENTRMAPTVEVQEAVSKINALRKLTSETGCITRRTQSIILGTLRPDVLTAVAEILASQPEAASRG